jgi:hypothetical protein
MFADARSGSAMLQETMRESGECCYGAQTVVFDPVPRMLRWESSVSRHASRQWSHDHCRLQENPEL